METATPNQTPASPEIAALLEKLAESDKRARKAEIAHQLSEMRVKQLEEMLRLMRIKQFGPHGEHLSVAQMEMFGEEPGATLDEVAAEDPLSGHLFLFSKRQRARLRVKVGRCETRSRKGRFAWEWTQGWSALQNFV